MANSIIICLYLQEDNIKLNIYDDGQGFDINKALEQKGGKILRVGIRGMKERVESLEGQFIIRSKFGKGSEIDITLPLEGKT